MTVARPRSSARPAHAIDGQDRFFARPGDHVHFAAAPQRPRGVEPRLLDDLSCRHRRRRPIRQAPPSVLLDPDRDRLVALLVEVREDRRRRRERDLVLARPPAVEHADAKTFHVPKNTGEVPAARVERR